MNRIPVATLAFLLLGAFAAAAPPAETRRAPPPGRAHAPELRRQLVLRFDADGDGRLSEGERAAARAALQDRRASAQGGLRARIRERADANQDGTVDATERRAARERLRARLDRNGDGRVDRAERRAVRQQVREKVRQHRAQGGQTPHGTGRSCATHSRRPADRQ